MPLITGGDSSNKDCFGRKTNLFRESGDFAGNRETWEIFREEQFQKPRNLYNWLLLSEVTPIKISIKRTIDLENILDRICPLRTLEMAFQSTKISKFSGGTCPQTPLVAGPFTARLIHRWLKNKKTDFYILRKFDSLSVLTWYLLNEKITKVR